MRGFTRQADPAASSTSVHVEVKGSLDIPLQLGLLSDLGDPIMEQEIVREAVRIAVSEKLGYFDGLDVRISPSGGREGAPVKPNGEQHLQQLTESPTASAAAAATSRSYARRYCEVDVDLQRLGGCIEAIQRAYEDLLAQVHVVQEVLSGTGPFASPMGNPCTGDGGQQQQQQQQSSPSGSSANLFSSDALADSARLSPDGMLSLNTPLFNTNTNTTASSDNSSPVMKASMASARFGDAVQRLAVARQIVDGLLQGCSPDVVSAAAQQSASQQLQREAALMEQEHLNGNGDGGVGALHRLPSRMDHEVGVDAELRRGLLADDDEEENGDHGQGSANDDEHEEDDLDEEAMHDRYRREGYCPL